MVDTWPMPTLYHHWLNAPSRLIRILLEEKRITVDLRLEYEWQPRAAFLSLNPAGEVPVMVMDDGQAFSGTRAIAEYLEETVSQPVMIGDTPEGRYEVRRLFDWFHTKLGTEVTRHTVSERLLKRFLGMGQPDSEAIRCAAHNLRTHMRYIEFLTEDQNYLAGDRFTLADAAAAAHISVEDYFGTIGWRDWPGVKEWYLRVKSRRSVRSLLSDRVQGLTPPAHYSDLDF